jgi:hypothetical protein
MRGVRENNLDGLRVCRTEMLLVMFLSLGERRGHAFGKISQLFRICFQNIHELQIKNYNIVQKNDNLATWVRTGKIRWLPGKKPLFI